MNSSKSPRSKILMMAFRVPRISSLMADAHAVLGEVDGAQTCLIVGAGLSRGWY